MDELGEHDFLIHVRLRDSDWMASDSITGCYGIGKTVPHAIQDYVDHLDRFHLDIITWDGELAPHLQVKKKLTELWFRWRD